MSGGPTGGSGAGLRDPWGETGQADADLGLPHGGLELPLGGGTGGPGGTDATGGASGDASGGKDATGGKDGPGARAAKGGRSSRAGRGGKRAKGAAGSAGNPGSPGGVGGAAGDGHDPDEVTVQLDTPHPRSRAGGWSGADASDVPVFVDESGRRSRTFRRIGIAVGLACGAYAVVIVATLLSGNAGAPWLPVPGQKDDEPAGQVETSPEPSSRATGTPPGFAAPGVPGVTASGPVPPRPGETVAPSASGSGAPAAVRP
ncbi:hypothetical protein ACFWO0_31625, partial [Streptomyces sp. NPDC058461]